MTAFKISCVFDLTCPWCYNAHTYLYCSIYARKAKHPFETFHVNLVPFYLKPTRQVKDPSIPLFPVAAKSRQALREETYGKAYAQTVLENIQKASKEAGLKLNFNGLTGMTRNGHRLMQHAQRIKGAEVAEKLLNFLFRRYHEEEVDITDLDVLT